VSAAEIVWTKPDGTTLTKEQFDAEIERIERAMARWTIKDEDDGEGVEEQSQTVS